MYYSEVDAEMLRVREIVIANKKPRRIELQINLMIKAGGLTIDYKGYEESFEGVIQSYVERFPDAF